MLRREQKAANRKHFFVLAVWAAIVVGGSYAGTQLGPLLSTSLEVPGSASQAANVLLTEHFGEDAEGTFTVAEPVGPRSAAALERFGAALAEAARSVPTARALPPERAGGLAYAQVATSLDLSQCARYTSTLRAALASAGARGAYVTGPPALQYDITPVLAADLRRGELIALVAALVLLVAALGPSWSVLVPFAAAAGSTSAAMGAVYVMAHLFPVTLYVPNLVQLTGLGLAVDYSLLLVHRLRQELAKGAGSFDVALRATMASAGRTVAVSGLAVAVGLSALLVIPVPFVRSLGVAGLVVPLASVASALSLQPALLSLLGRRGLNARRWGGTTAAGRPRLWTGAARLTLAHPWASTLAAGTALLAACAPLAWLSLTPGSLQAIPAGMASAHGLALLRQDVGLGVITPIEVVVEADATGGARATGGGRGARGGATSPAMDAATMRLGEELLDQPDVFVVAIGSRPPYVDATDSYRRTFVVERGDFGDPSSQALVQLLRQRLLPAAHFPPGARAYVGGAPAQGADFLTSTYRVFPLVAALVAVLSLAVLYLVLGSLVLPLLSLALDALSVGAACGLVVVTFRWGLGARALGLYQVGQVEGWVPVFLFTMLFGLSMDYQVFFLSRMREARQAGATAREAIAEGLTRTGPVVSAAALVMVGALTGLVAGRVAGLQELGVGLALGVALDATVVRGVLMPALMALLGPYCWWRPRRGVA